MKLWLVAILSTIWDFIKMCLVMCGLLVLCIAGLFVVCAVCYGIGTLIPPGVFVWLGSHIELVMTIMLIILVCVAFSCVIVDKHKELVRAKEAVDSEYPDED